jgi:hypothetical protein
VGEPSNPPESTFGTGEFRTAPTNALESTKPTNPRHVRHERNGVGTGSIANWGREKNFSILGKKHLFRGGPTNE